MLMVGLGVLIRWLKVVLILEDHVAGEGYLILRLEFGITRSMPRWQRRAPLFIDNYACE